MSDAWEPVESASDPVSLCGAFHNAMTVNMQIIFNLRYIIYNLHSLTSGRPVSYRYTNRSDSTVDIYIVCHT